jgi:hypothetical protein
MRVPGSGTDKKLAAPKGIDTSLFHQAWWLEPATDGRIQEVSVERGGQIVGRLPYVISHVGPFRVSKMPPFTHILGPVVDSGVGKPQTRLVKRLSIVRELIDQLPRVSLFEQQFDPALDDGLALCDGLAFQDRGYAVSTQYNFLIDCRAPVAELWEGMHFKTRQHIRRAEEKYIVRPVDDATAFTQFYLRNTRIQGRRNHIEFGYFGELCAACRERNAGQMLGAFKADGTPVSMVFLVSSDTTMYYQLSTRGADPEDNGSINLLIWAAMQLAHARGLSFDFDGVYNSGSARFLSGFGGQIRTRLVARRGRSVFSLLQFLKLRYSRNETHRFT